MRKIKNKSNNNTNNSNDNINNSNDDNKVFVVNKNKIEKNDDDNDLELFDDNFDSFSDSIKLTKSKLIKLTIKTKSKNSSSSNSSSSNSSSSNSSSSNSSSSNSNNKSQKKTSSTSLTSPKNKNLYDKIKDKNVYFNEMLKKQIGGIPSDKKLNYNDIKRISKFIKSSIFDKKKCSIWAGYITNENNSNKGTYINFYFNKKKIALHRLLYINYVGILSDNEYLKFSCENKGKCCNIHHMNKYTYNNTIKNSNTTTDSNNMISNEKTNDNKSINSETSETVQINVDKDKLIVEI
jgi:hypothetical protein